MTTSNLPTPATPLVGRRRAARDLAARLAETRLVTLSGPGGCGKTRLALHVAGTVASRFAAGAWWCDLSPLADPALIAQAVATSLGVQDTVGAAAVASLVKAIGPVPRLLVLDNCEHLLAAAAGLVDALLRGCPHLHILATSLQPLGLPGEQVWPLPPLPLPPADLPPARLADNPAVSLFVTRATAVAPGFRLTTENAPLVAAICRRLDGLPLAIELAAARANVLSLEQIEVRLAEGLTLLSRQAPATLKDAAGRHRTLTAMLAWGYGLLSADEQDLFRRLAVFPGSFTLEAAAAVAGETETTTLEPLAGLVHKSMVTAVDLPARGAARYRLLEPVRAYAREQLEEMNEGGHARDGHLVWAVALAGRAAGLSLGPIGGDAMAQLEAEYDSLRAALRWTVTARRVEAGLRLVVALFRLWFHRGPLGEGRSWAEELLNLPAAAEAPSLLRARAAFVSGRLACRQGDDRVALARGTESLRLAQEAGAHADEARAHDLLGLASHDLNDFDGAIAHHGAALALRRTMGDDYAVAVSLNNLGLVHFDRAEYDEAAANFTASLEAASRAGIDLLSGLQNLAEIALARGDGAAAAAYAHRQLALAETAGDQHSVATAIGTLAAAARLAGEPSSGLGSVPGPSPKGQALAEAARLGEQALALLRRLDAPTWEGDVLRELGDLAVMRGDLVAGRVYYTEGLDAHARAGSTGGRGVLLARLAMTAVLLGEPDAALAQAREAVVRLASTPHRHPLIEAVEAAAVALAATEPAAAATCLAAAAAERSRLGIPRLPPWRDLVEQTAAHIAAPVASPVPLPEAARLAAGAQLATAPVAASPPAPELHACALGTAQVTVGGRPVPAAAWTYRKAHELFFYLLDRAEANKATIGLDLWPDASSEQLRNYLHRSLHFIRRALGSADRITFEQGAYRINRDLPLRYDVAEFEAGLRQAAALGPLVALTAERRAARIALLEGAVTLWRGEFLADLDAGEWAIFRREELYMAYLRGLLDLGQACLLDGRYAEAATVYRRALAEDPYLELAERELMRCLARQGESGRALRRYRVLSTRLEAELGAMPSAETTLLYERIRRGDDV